MIRWTKLRKITGQAFSEVGKRNFGRPTCVAISTNIIIGTSKGLVLVFDYQQNHKGIIGPGTQAAECGPVTSLAVSADHSTLASGHADGHIFTWEILRAARPFLQISPVIHSQAQARTSDGHVRGAPVLHLGFLGTRHTALVSADGRGMAFSHLATRGMGAVGRTVKTTRILGRYSDLVTRTTKPRKPSAVLAFAPLPLGNVEQASDAVGLVAMMTPYLLVIVSTTPIAQTQYKVARPKEIRAHGAMSAALAWFPAIKLKGRGTEVSRNKLVYCWSNMLMVLEVDEVEPSEPTDKEKPPEFQFQTRTRWTTEEAIVAVQWLSRSVLAVLTITQQLVILEDHSMEITDSFDLLQKHVYHSDLFSQQLRALVEQLDEEDTSMHGVVADAFYMSFRAYKGRLFLLGFNDISVGNLSNWADRLLALMESGDFITAIRLATTYYSGSGQKVTIGLPEEDEQRHDLVRTKLLEMMSASLKFAFGRSDHADTEPMEKPHLAELAKVCMAACVTLDDRDFLFDEVYNWYEDHNLAGIFLDVIEPYIISGELRALPPPTVKALIEHYTTNHSASDLEEIICLLESSTMDIDQVTSLCKRYNLYDAYIYVWTKTMEDFIGPIEELLSMAETTQSNGHVGNVTQRQATAMKLFPYLSFSLTGRQYPNGTDLPDDLATKAKAQIYTFLFSGQSRTQNMAGPTRKATNTHSTRFPHLRSILAFDSASFLSVLNEAFEDSFLNDAPAHLSNGAALESRGPSPVYNQAINRQFIVSILLEVMTPPEFSPDDTVFLDMFLARNLPKYPQYILLSGSTLQQALVRLCHFPDEDLAEDCQLSVEYLLSIYHPPDWQSLIPTLRDAKFFRVLKHVYRTENQYPQLTEMFFKDPDGQDAVFDVLTSLLLPGSDLTQKQRRELEATVEQHASDFFSIDVSKTAKLIARLLPDLHDRFLEAIEDDPRSQFEYLQALLEPDERASDRIVNPLISPHLIERYVQLMCRFEPKHVPEYVDIITTSDLHLDKILPALETSGIIDAAVILLARQGQVKDAMVRLQKHISTLEAALVGILQNLEESPDVENTGEAIEDLLDSLDKYAKVGTWLCQRQTNAMPKAKAPQRAIRRSNGEAQPLSFEETLWLTLVNAVVDIARNILPFVDNATGINVAQEVSSRVRATVQQVFTALLTATTSAREGSLDRSDLSFLRILRVFLTEAAAASPSLSQLRGVIASIFSAYAYEETLLSLSNEMLSKDLFVHVDEVAKLRQQGWRPRGQTCEICRRRVWGPGTGGQIWEAWQKKEAKDIRRRQEKQKEQHGEDETSLRGKGRAVDEESGDETQEGTELSGQERGEVGPILVFACRHLYHQRCLQKNKEDGGKDGKAITTRPGEEPNIEMACAICT